MKPIVKQILSQRAKSRQVDTMLNPPDVIAGGPGSGRRGGGRKKYDDTKIGSDGLNDNQRTAKAQYKEYKKSRKRK